MRYYGLEVVSEGYPIRIKDVPGEAGRPDREFVSLSIEDRQTIRRIRLGWSNKQIADGLGIPVATVKARISTIMRKGGFSNRVCIALWATRYQRLIEGCLLKRDAKQFLVPLEMESAELLQELQQKNDDRAA